MNIKQRGSNMTFTFDPRALALVLMMACGTAYAAETTPTTATATTTGTQADTAATSGSEILFSENFEKIADGAMPEKFMVLSGDFAVQTIEGNRVFQHPGVPLDTCGVLFGASQGANVAVSAKVFSKGKRRIAPLFGVGLHGVRGYRLQVAATKDMLELYRGEALLGSVAYEWQSESWTHLKLQSRQVSEGQWKVEGKVWIEGAEEPKEWTISADDAKAPVAGRSSIWAAPYAENPIMFDNLELRAVPAAGAPGA